MVVCVEIKWENGLKNNETPVTSSLLSLLASSIPPSIAIVALIHGFTWGVDELFISKLSYLRRKDILETSAKESKKVHLQFSNNNSTGFDFVQDFNNVILKA
ncbi:hypothetical protein J5N97_025602 [Dioscorea zingiberensis]|uniref:Uncharacterized protein n=1 Tax=Dioscorea zingiberensis TaxID=325984 RepID=A0A9D5C1P3_9LILI|nr:hypothetical protein J5N97_025602 [Dioscorea zingiberensis]